MDTINIEHLARLAQIRLNETDRVAALADLSNIIGMIDQMQTVDTDGVAPLAHPLDATQRLRADEVTETDRREIYQRGAPQVDEGLYLVPRVVE